ncbi:unnamed protein product [Rotaria socialis]|uniref:BED-type domain-containing protein n=1 Tax=Rotaria socialis TaxID=392032 RepID=A0A818NRI7_9BILA|nr:unnamed protein product [Rotaria socialis]CAF4665603.1 unnamed protein product [Rotaria socialis]
MSHVKNEINHLNKTLRINITIPNVSRPSFVWSYFEQLYKKPNTALDLKRLYCKVCFDKIKEERPDDNCSSIRSKVANYGTTSSTGNMKTHLLAAHQIQEVQAMKVTEKHVLTMFSRHRDRDATKNLQLKINLGIN